MSAKRTDTGEVEEPVKKGPLLIIALLLLLIFLLITGFLLVRWYLEMMEQAEMVNSGRVLLSGVAVLVLTLFTVIGLVNVIRGKQRKTRKPVAKRKSPIRATSPAKRKKTRKNT